MYSLDRANFNVTINTKTVLENLKKGRERHIKTFAEAREAYRLQMIKNLRHVAHQFESLLPNEPLPKSAIPLARPESSLRDYDGAIAMLKQHTEENFVLSSELYRCFMMDMWQWSGSFNSNVTSLGVKVDGLEGEQEVV